MKVVSLASLSILLLASVTPAQSLSHLPSLSPKQLMKAEKAVGQLEEFSAFAKGSTNSTQYTKRLRKLSAEVSNTTNELPEGDVRTNLATALHFYELASNDSQRLLEPSPFSCATQKPGIYQRLCHEAVSRRDLLLKKAQLHVDWSKALITTPRTGFENAILSEIRQQRELDQRLANRAVAALKRLENVVIVYESLGDFEAELKVSTVGYDDFQQHLRETVFEVRQVLALLPRSRVRAELNNALSSYQDGAFWWGQVQQPKVISVAGLAFESRRAPIENIYLSTAPYTVVINWRNAGRSLRRAEALLQ